jgi:hypothetical protein
MVGITVVGAWRVPVVLPTKFSPVGLVHEA